MLHDIVLAVGEALANAAEHGYRPDGTVTVDAPFKNGGVEIQIADDGRAFSPKPRRAAPSPTPRGFGIVIMRSVMDVTEFHNGGPRVLPCKRIASGD